MLLEAALLVVGVVWVYVVLARCREDLDELRTVKDTVRRVVIVGIWAVTALIAILLANFALGLLMLIFQVARKWF